MSSTRPARSKPNASAQFSATTALRSEIPSALAEGEQCSRSWHLCTTPVVPLSWCASSRYQSSSSIPRPVWCSKLVLVLCALRLDIPSPTPSALSMESRSQGATMECATRTTIPATTQPPSSINTLATSTYPHDGTIRSAYSAATLVPASTSPVITTNIPSAATTTTTTTATITSMNAGDDARPLAAPENLRQPLPTTDGRRRCRPTLFHVPSPKHPPRTQTALLALGFHLACIQGHGTVLSGVGDVD